MKQKLFMLPALLLVAIVACSTAQRNVAEESAEGEPTDVSNDEDFILSLPDLAPIKDEELPLRVVATTSIIGDVVAQVGEEQIVLSTLMAPGQDPHGYEPAARDLTTVADAHVIFVNGWGLEESLITELEEISEAALIVPVSAGIRPLLLGEQGHEHNGEKGTHTATADPHVWFDVQNVMRWVDNIENVLSELDPTNADAYASNADSYRAELESLAQYAESQLAQIPQEQRSIVTNHNALGYFTERYTLDLIGTVIPAASTLAEPAPTNLAALIEAMREHNVCTIFTETIANDALAQTVGDELDTCETVAVVSLYTDALGPPGSGAGSFVEMYRANVDAIVKGLKK